MCKRLPDAADKAFVEVLGQQPHNPQALYGKAMLLAECGKESAAIACFDEALAWHPLFVDARRFRAILWARQDKLAAAREDINRCLELEPQAGTTLYAAACVLALAADKNPDGDVRSQQQAQAIRFLARAFSQGYGQAGAAADPDSALHRCPEFEALLKKPQPGKTHPRRQINVPEPT